MTDRTPLKEWFCREVLPLEPVLMRFLRRNWRNAEEVIDFRQDVYAKIFAAAAQAPILNVKAFMLTTARNVLLNQAKRASIVSFELVGDIADRAGMDELSPERHAIARDELKQIRAVIARLPPRCQEIILLRKVEGMSHLQIAERSGLSLRTVESHIRRGMQDIASYLLERADPGSPEGQDVAGSRSKPL